MITIFCNLITICLQYLKATKETTITLMFHLDRIYLKLQYDTKLAQ